VPRSLLRRVLLASLVWGIAASSWGEPSSAQEDERAIAGLEAQLNDALARRDRAALDPLLADPFIWVHSRGAIDDRNTWLDQAAKGRAVQRQIADTQEFDPRIVVYPAGTALRTSRIRFRYPGGSRELWICQTKTYVRSLGKWQLAAAQGAALYDGPVTGVDLYARYAGVYVIDTHRELKLDWDGDALMATFPNGLRQQIFLGSPTEEVTLGNSRLRFVLDEKGQPLEAISMERDKEAWRARRKQ
jgi:hypothetical protein